MQVYIPAFPDEHWVRNRLATPFLKEVFFARTLSPIWQGDNEQILYICLLKWIIIKSLKPKCLYKTCSCSYFSIISLFIMALSQYGNQLFTIVIPGNAHRPTSSDNTLKSSITSFTNCTIPEQFFEVRRFQALDLCLFGILIERRSQGQWASYTGVSSTTDQSGWTTLSEPKIFS